VVKSPEHPAVFVLGGAKISDAFGMIEQVLSSGTADRILACGVTGQVMLMASGIGLGGPSEKFITDRNLDVFIEPARKYLEKYPGKILMPVDLAFEKNGRRQEVLVKDLPMDEMFMDIGEKTINLYESEIRSAGMVFVNGPAGVFENQCFQSGTERLWKAIASAPGFTVVGGGDSVSAAARFTGMDDYSYVCTAGGAMVRFLSGKKLPLIAAMEKAGQKWK